MIDKLKYKIEKLSKNDYEKFIQMFLDYFIVDCHVKYDAKKLEENLVKKTILKNYEKGTIFIDVIRNDLELLGFIIYQIDSDKSDWNLRPGSGFIREFYIKRDVRKQGLGSMLLSYAEQVLQKNGVKDVYLTSDELETVKLFYLKNGYTNTKVRCEFNKDEIFEKQI